MPIPTTPRVSTRPRPPTSVRTEPRSSRPPSNASVKRSAIRVQREARQSLSPTKKSANLIDVHEERNAILRSLKKPSRMDIQENIPSLTNSPGKDAPSVKRARSEGSPLSQKMPKVSSDSKSITPQRPVSGRRFLVLDEKFENQKSDDAHQKSLLDIDTPRVSSDALAKPLSPSSFARSGRQGNEESQHHDLSMVNPEDDEDHADTDCTTEKEATPHSTEQSLEDRIRAEYETEILSLRAALEGKEAEIRAIQASLQQSETARMTSSRSTRDKIEKLMHHVHGIYSQKHRNKIQMLKQQWEAKVNDLNQQVIELEEMVRIERMEKEELVTTCDAYLAMELGQTPVNTNGL
uniref:ARAD1D05324p n=1 Tax=Blastobotrys adeninivorans TaxID=409370 RepID=A0A060TDA0_BLAAD